MLFCNEGNLDLNPGLVGPGAAPQVQRCRERVGHAGCACWPGACTAALSAWEDAEDNEKTPVLVKGVLVVAGAAVGAAAGVERQEQTQVRPERHDPLRPLPPQGPSPNTRDFVFPIANRCDSVSLQDVSRPATPRTDPNRRPSRTRL